MKERTKNRLTVAAILTFATLFFATSPWGYFVGSYIAAYAQQQPGTRLHNGTVFENHMLVGGIPPTVTNATIRAGSTDHAGEITSTGSSNPVLTFGTPFTVKPFCSMYNQGEAENVTLTVTATTMTFGGLENGAIASYICYGTQAN